MYQCLPLQNMLLWYKDYFELKAIEKKQIGTKQALCPPPTCLKTRRKFVQKSIANNPRGVSAPEDSTKQTTDEPLSSVILPCVYLPAICPLETQKSFSFVLSLL